MIAIPSEPLFTAREASKVAFSRLRTVRLQFSLQAEAALADFAPTPFAMEAVIAGHGWMANAQINSEGLLICDERNIRQVNGYMQPELPVTVDQISGSRLVSSKRKSVVRDVERNLLATGHGGQADNPGFPINSVGVAVEPRRTEARNWTTNFEPFLFQRQRRFDGFSRFLNCLYVVIGNQSRGKRLGLTVGQLVQREGVAFFETPSDGADVIKGFRKLLYRSQQAFGLFVGWFEEQFDRARHYIKHTTQVGDYAK